MTFSKLRQSSRFLWFVATIALSLPLAIQALFFVRLNNKAIDFAIKEKHGLAFAEPLLCLLSLSSGPSSTPEGEVAARDGCLANLDDANSSYGRELGFSQEDLFANGREQYSVGRLREQIVGAKEYFDRRAIIEQLVAMIDIATDSSNLILDPDLDSYYLMDAAVLILPRMMRKIALARLNAEQGRTSELSAGLAEIHQIELRQLAAAIRKAVREDANYYGTSRTLASRLATIYERYLEPLNALIAATSSGDGVSSASRFDAALLSLFTLSQEIRSELDTLLDQRLEGARWQRNSVIATVLGLWLVVMLVISVLYKRYVRLNSDAAMRSDQLTGANAKLASFFNASSDSVVCLNDRRQIVDFNPAAERLFGYGRDEVIGRDIASLLTPLPVRADQGNLINNFKFKEAGRTSVQSVEIVLLSKDGHEVSVELTARQFDNEGLTYFVMCMRDLRESKEKDRVIEQQRTMAVESARLSGLGEMAGGIVHEINNPLAVISGMGDLALRSLEKEVPDVERAKAQLAKVSGMVKRITDIIKSMRSLARNDAADPATAETVTSVVKMVADIFDGRLKKSSIQLRVVPFDESIRALMRPTQIGQVLVNLLSNAADAIEGTDAPWIEIDVKVAGGVVTIYVTNSGPKIPDEVQARMFQAFFTTKPVGKGTGIGLSVSRKLCQDHDGDLTLDSNFKSTRFCVRLPAASVPGRAEAA